ncbi:hypothetical protein HAZT_HAZT012254 [Hyalella azteca]|uniref:RRM domain-containing protein n=1 Tax=Hyalella azteca TaxID=294128 RepID=A0A6A0GV13_HYAAZ|nr:hypothetical protein HAZT_HAZT012254 [Hyalella azteca]
MSSPKSADTSPSPAPSSVGGSNAPKFGTVIPNRVFVGGISSSTTEQDLLELFSNYGTVKATKVINDRAGVSKGYGFVTFETEEEARRLTQEADNIMLKERKLNIAPAIKKQVSDFGGFMKAYSPRLVDGVTGAGGMVAGNPATTVFFTNPTAAAAAAAAAYYNQQQQQLLAAAAAANSQGGVQPEYATAGHHPTLAYANQHHLATQAAYQSQAAAAQQAAAMAAVSNGGSSSSPTQPQYAQPHSASPAATYAYPHTLYYPHYQLHAAPSNNSYTSNRWRSTMQLLQLQLAGLRPRQLQALLHSSGAGSPPRRMQLRLLPPTANIRHVPALLH